MTTHGAFAAVYLSSTTNPAQPHTRFSAMCSNKSLPTGTLVVGTKNSLERAPGPRFCGGICQGSQTNDLFSSVTITFFFFSFDEVSTNPPVRQQQIVSRSRTKQYYQLLNRFASNSGILPMGYYLWTVLSPSPFLGV